VRALLLDFDGVIHPLAAPGEPVVHFQWLHVLAELLALWADVRVAVHSTWRYLHTPGELQELLGPLGPRFIGAVPRGPRADAILWFLHLNATVQSQLVLDDAAGEFPGDFPGSLVLCDSLLDISAPDVRAGNEAWLTGGAP
jgi:hypothetical protein